LFDLNCLSLEMFIFLSCKMMFLNVMQIEIVAGFVSLISLLLFLYQSLISVFCHLQKVNVVWYVSITNKHYSYFCCYVAVTHSNLVSLYFVTESKIWNSLPPVVLAAILIYRSLHSVCLCMLLRCGFSVCCKYVI